MSEPRRVPQFDRKTSDPINASLTAEQRDKKLQGISLIDDKIRRLDIRMGEFDPPQYLRDRVNQLHHLQEVIHSFTNNTLSELMAVGDMLRRVDETTHLLQEAIDKAIAEGRRVEESEQITDVVEIETEDDFEAEIETEESVVVHADPYAADSVQTIPESTVDVAAADFDATLEDAEVIVHPEDVAAAQYEEGRLLNTPERLFDELQLAFRHGDGTVNPMQAELDVLMRKYAAVADIEDRQGQLVRADVLKELQNLRVRYINERVLFEADTVEVPEEAKLDLPIDYAEDPTEVPEPAPGVFPAAEVQSPETPIVAAELATAVMAAVEAEAPRSEMERQFSKLVDKEQSLREEIQGAIGQRLISLEGNLRSLRSHIDRYLDNRETLNTVLAGPAGRHAEEQYVASTLAYRTDQRKRSTLAQREERKRQFRVVPDIGEQPAQPAQVEADVPRSEARMGLSETRMQLQDIFKQLASIREEFSSELQYEDLRRSWVRLNAERENLDKIKNTPEFESGVAELAKEVEELIANVKVRKLNPESTQVAAPVASYEQQVARQQAAEPIQQAMRSIEQHFATRPSIFGRANWMKEARKVAAQLRRESAGNETAVYQFWLQQVRELDRNRPLIIRGVWREQLQLAQRERKHYLPAVKAAQQQAAA